MEPARPAMRSTGGVRPDPRIRINMVSLYAIESSGQRLRHGGFSAQGARTGLGRPAPGAALAPPALGIFAQRLRPDSGILGPTHAAFSALAAAAAADVI